MLKRIKDSVTIEDEHAYKRVTIKTSGQGVFLRDTEKGRNIGTKKQFRIRQGQFILSKIDARNGAFGIVGEDLDGAIITGNFWTFEVNKERLNIEWFNLSVSSQEFVRICEITSSGTTNRKYLDEKKFLNHEVYLPSTKEQDTTVACLRERKGMLDIVTSEITFQETRIGQLRSQILDDAVTGKLVPQNPDDESSKEALDTGWEEQDTPQGKKRKKEKLFQPVSPKEAPLELPQGWSWFTLESLSIDVVDCPHATPQWTEQGFICVRTTNFRPGLLDLSEVRYVSEDTFRSRNRRIEPMAGDILYSREGGILGVACMVPPDVRICMGQRMLLIRPSKHCIPEFLMHVLNSQLTLKHVNSLISGSASPHLNVGDIRKFLIPLPPLREQAEIVKKLDSLSQLVGQLEEQLRQSSKYRDLLMDTLLAEAFRTKETFDDTTILEEFTPKEVVVSEG